MKKTYWAVVKNAPKEPEGELVHFLVRNEKQNKSYAYDKEVPNSKKAILHYRLIGHSENYFLLEVDLKTGRHHQIRCQLAKMGCPIKGDLKYGSPRSNPDGSICLHARRVRFIHPVSKELIELEAPLPEGNLWKGFAIDHRLTRNSTDSSIMLFIDVTQFFCGKPCKSVVGTCQKSKPACHFSCKL